MVAADEAEESNDPAGRLHGLCNKIVDASKKARNENGSFTKAPLWQALEPIAIEIGVKNYAQLRNNFILLTESVNSGIHRLTLRRPSVRDHWFNTVTRIASVFDAQQFPKPSNQVFAECFQAADLATLDAISERFQNEGWQEKPKECLEEALSAVKDVIDEMEVASSFPPEMLRVLRHLASQMEIAVATFDTFGAESFWRTYKETFATFVQLHGAIREAPNEATIREKMNKVTQYLVDAISVTANVTTVGSVVVPLLIFGG